MMSRKAFRFLQINTIVSFIACLLFFTSAHSTTFYVDAEIGNDAYLGTSSSSPWKTVSKVNSSSFLAGDFILFKRGGVWRETLVVPSSGISGKEITFGAYGIGGKPVIAGSDDVTLPSFRWTLSIGGNNEYYLEAAGSGNPGFRATPNAVWMNDTYLMKGSVGSLRNHQWAWGDNDSLGFSTIYIRNDTGDPDNAGILIEAAMRDRAVLVDSKSYVVFDNLHIKHNNSAYRGVFETRDTNSITLQNSDIHDAFTYAVVYWLRSDNGKIVNSSVYGNRDNDSYGSVVSFEFSNNNIIKDNTLHTTNSSGGDVVKVYNSDGNIFESNDVSGPAENGIYCRPDSDNNVIRYNFIHDINGIGVQIRELSDNNYIYYNILMRNDGPAMQSDGRYPTSSCTAQYNNRFINNTVYNNAGANGIHIFGVNFGIEVKNNSIFCEYGDCIAIEMDDPGGYCNMIGEVPELDHNNYYKYGSSGSYLVWLGRNYYTLGEFSAASGQDLNSIAEQPLNKIFPPQTQTDVQLISDSPLIDAGIKVIGLDRDYFGKSVPGGVSVDIGAVEYTTVPMPPTNLVIVR